MRRGTHRHDTGEHGTVLGDLEPVLGRLQALLHLRHTEVREQM